MPTNTEWDTANAFDGGAATNVGATVGWDNNAETYESALKLPSAGYRIRSTGLLNTQGTHGYYWSSTVSTVFGTNARHLYFFSTAANTTDSTRALGFSVRCLKN